MARVINTNSPGKRRSAHMRTIAEILRRLSQQRAINAETKDMTAMLVYCLRGISATVEESSQAWEKRGYWKKAIDFQDKWWWAERQASAIETLIKKDDWQTLPEIMVGLFPHFADMQISRLTRDPKNWVGAFERLRQELNRTN